MPFISGGSVTDNVYQYKISFGDAGSNTVRWTTNLYYRANETAIAADTFNDHVTDVVVALTPILYRPYQIQSITISTRQPDSDPYNANEFKTYPIGIQGTKVETGVSVYTPRFGARVIKQVTSGRSGSYYLRGVLSEANTVSNQQGTRLEAATFLELAAAIDALENADERLFDERDVTSVTVSNAPTGSTGRYITRDVINYTLDGTVTIFKQRNR